MNYALDEIQADVVTGASDPSYGRDDNIKVERVVNVRAPPALCAENGACIFFYSRYSC